ncbi:MAG: patatin-like phospholipase family protein [Chloroflexia bacterium]|nr:patatin-like phospholipase family protein [Chloroflexia bacterium]
MNAVPGGSTGSLSDVPPYASASLECDLVMKGGITSGVVYPKAVVRVARGYRIRKVGGTSVGAIAAALTAAAEYYRRTSPTEDHAQWDALDAEIMSDLSSPRDKPYTSNEPGFAGLYGIPGDIGSNLVRKFQPPPRLRELFEYFIAIADSPKVLKPFTALFWRLFLARSCVAMLFLGIALWIRLTGVEAIRYALSGFAVLFALSAVPFIVSYLLPVRTKTPLQTMPEIVSWLFRGVLVLAVFGGVYLVRWRFGPAGLSPTPGNVFYPIPEIIEQFRNVTDAPTSESRQEAQENRFTIITGAIAILLGWIIGGVVALVWYLTGPVKSNFMGVCTGLGDEEALTNWLSTKINRVAGLDPQGSPLTFGQLKGKDTETAIIFEAITSDVTRGVPLDLPNALTNYEFKPSEFREFFPENVLRQLGVAQGGENLRNHMPFPDPAYIPLVVVARMSMSFPVLFSAIPVYYKNEPRGPDQPDSDRFKRCWLSDGGVVSNFPVHKFDSALPLCPTFAFDLIQKPDPIPGNHVPLNKQVSTNPILPPGETTEREMYDPERISAPKMQDLMGLLSGIVNTSRGWMDNPQKKLPGYAERIVGIHLYKDEGGLNLTMDGPTIERLARRGLFGAHDLVRTWNPGDAQGEWHQHRWLRYRMLMRELEELGNEWRKVIALDTVPVHDPPIAALVAEFDRTETLVHRWASKSFSDSGQVKSSAFAAFARNQASTAQGGVVFSQQKIPKLNPKLFTIPPFE